MTGEINLKFKSGHYSALPKQPFSRLGCMVILHLLKQNSFMQEAVLTTLSTPLLVTNPGAEWLTTWVVVKLLLIIRSRFLQNQKTIFDWGLIQKSIVNFFKKMYKNDQTSTP